MNGNGGRALTLRKLVAAGGTALWLLALPVGFVACAPAATQVGIASYYHRSFHGRKTASGEPYDKRRYTAAHKRLAFGTKVRVTSLATGRSVLVRINDRGPHVKGRIIDLSRRAARDLGMLKTGLLRVRLEVVDRADTGGF